MFKQATLAAALATAGMPAMAGFYVNPEFNKGYVCNDPIGSVLDLHVGFEGQANEKLGYYVQGGPSILYPTSGEGSTELGGKVGASYALTEKVSAYGEFSGISSEDTDNAYGLKLGGKFTF